LKILILGASGLLGGACFQKFNEQASLNVVGTFRSLPNQDKLKQAPENYYLLTDVLNVELLRRLFDNIEPDVVINCISLNKTTLNQGNPIDIIPLYSLLPHILANMCSHFSARLIQISSDGVFSGDRGEYSEDDRPDATDIYGRSKLLGEVVAQNCITLRTSMIGHGVKPHNGLVNWFLAQNESCKGYPHVIFSGFPVLELAQIIRDFVLTQPELTGIYHIASDPISKYELLLLIAEVYGSSVSLLKDSSIKINRSLNAKRFRLGTGYIPPGWPHLINTMYRQHIKGLKNNV
jgi:dTDP-4-dehydrorhamnose reductase